MSDTAPERIWADYWLTNGTARQITDDDLGGCTEYVRADLYDAQAAEIAALQAKVEKLTGALAESKEMLVVSFKEFSDCADADYFDRLCGSIKRCSAAITPEGE